MATIERPTHKQLLIELYQDLSDMAEDMRAASRRATRLGLMGFDFAGRLVAEELRLESLMDSIAKPGTVPQRKRTVTYDKAEEWPAKAK